MTSKLDQYLSLEFHKEYSQLLYESSRFHFDFMDSNNHLVIDVRDFPNISYQVLSPSEAIKLKKIPDQYFTDYITHTLAYSLVVVYLYEDNECFIMCQKTNEDNILENVMKAQTETETYLRAYENGLVKEAYEKAKNTGEPVIFSIINGEAKLFSKADAIDIITKYRDQFGEVDDWLIICVDANPSLVSFIYINEEENQFWYDTLSEQYEDHLFDKWDMEPYWDED